MAVTLQEINALRQKTQAGLMDCKKALTEANGDMEAAMEILRKKGQLPGKVSVRPAMASLPQPWPM